MKPELHQLLKKYDIAGPRYTSYPTAPAWTENVSITDLKKSLANLQKNEPLSLYFHLPFCENLCHFCGCMKVITKQHEKSAEYLKVLLCEMDTWKKNLPENHGPVNQIHFGGGSPNFFQPNELKKILDHARTHFSFLPDAEIAIEMHPRTSTPEFCQMAAQLGFNRISLGIQDFDPRVQKLINRHQTFEMTRDMLNLLKNLGLRSFNFDLIYGLPGQTLETWQKTLNQVLELKPDRLAVYSYAHVPWLKPYQRSFEDKDLPPPELKLALFEKAYETFTKNGYCLIGMDHFALETDDLAKALKEGSIHRNFMGYSTKADAHQIGFGVSSISYINGNYFQNRKELSEYNTAIDNEDFATFRGYLLNADDHCRRALIQSLMCLGHVDIPTFEKKWNLSFENYFKNSLIELKPLIQDGLLSLTKDRIQVLEKGFLFLRNIAMPFDRHLADLQKKNTGPLFSKTV